MAVAPGSNFAPMGLGGPGSAPNYRASTAQLPGVTSGIAPWLPQGGGTTLDMSAVTGMGGAGSGGGGSSDNVPWHVKLSQEQAAKGKAQQEEMARQKAQAEALKAQQAGSGAPSDLDPDKWAQAQQEIDMMKRTDPNLSGYDEQALKMGIYRNLGARTDSSDGGDDGGDGGGGDGGDGGDGDA